jgi:hypothetical protein
MLSMEVEVTASQRRDANRFSWKYYYRLDFNKVVPGNLAKTRDIAANARASRTRKASFGPPFVGTG